MQTSTQLQITDVTVEVVRKHIKHVHLRVYPPDGQVRVSAPVRMQIEDLRGFVISKLEWIRHHQEKQRQQQPEPPRKLLDPESHYIWGKPYTLKVLERARTGVVLQNDQMILSVKPGSDTQRRAMALQRWYRQEFTTAIEALRAKWEPVLNVSARSISVRRMRTRWGSCTPLRAAIRLNLSLVKKPPVCLEYIFVHELAHLLEPSHNHRFYAHMDRLIPNWRQHRTELNHLPVPHADWLLGCSGHIHESPHQPGGQWVAKIGRTAWLQPGQVDCRLHDVTLDITAALDIVNVRHSIFGVARPDGCGSAAGGL